MSYKYVNVITAIRLSDLLEEIVHACDRAVTVIAIGLRYWHPAVRMQSNDYCDWLIYLSSSGVAYMTPGSLIKSHDTSLSYHTSFHVSILLGTSLRIYATSNTDATCHAFPIFWLYPKVILSLYPKLILSLYFPHGKQHTDEFFSKKGAQQPLKISIVRHSNQRTEA